MLLNLLLKLCFIDVVTSLVMKIKPYSISTPSIKRTIKSQELVVPRSGRYFSASTSGSGCTKAEDGGRVGAINLNTSRTRKSTRIRNKGVSSNANIESKWDLNEDNFTSKQLKNGNIAIGTTTSVNKAKPSSYWDIKDILQECKTFASASTWTGWLSENHSTASHVWIKIAKLHSNLPSVSRKDALQVALCYGWIDGVCKGIDELYFLQRYTPRRNNSNWSLVNKTFAGELIAAGLMRESGFKAIDAAKADGRWDKNSA